MDAVESFGIFGKIGGYVRVGPRLRDENRNFTMECEEVMKIFGNKVLYPVHLGTYGKVDALLGVGCNDDFDAFFSKFLH